MEESGKRNIESIIGNLLYCNEKLTYLIEGEADYRDNLQDEVNETLKYIAAETIIDHLETARDLMNEVIDILDHIN